MSSQSKAKKIVTQSKLPEMDSVYISNFLVNSALQSYVNEFKSRVVPFSFVGMFFKALKKSKAVNENKILKSFYADESTNINTYCYLYFLTFKQIASAVIEDKKYGSAMVLKKVAPPPLLSLFLREAPRLDEALDVIQQEQLAFVNQSKGYVKKAFTLYLMGSDDFVVETENVQKTGTKETTEEAEKPKVNVNDLVGKEVNLPATEGKKIYHLYIPTLPLPTKYPKSQSRVHSSYLATKFASPTKIVDFISNFGIVQVKYTESFIDLREQTEVKANKPEKKLNWSDFF